MATVGLIGTGLAYLNLKKAENEYNALVDQQDALIAALETMRSEKNYEEKKAEIEEEKDWVDPDPIDLMPGISCTTILRVGNLAGKLFKAKASVVISNMSDRSYYIESATATCRVFDLPVLPIDMGSGKPKDQVVAVGKTINPGEVMGIELPGGTTGLYTADEINKLPELRQLVCDAAGKKLITSIWYSFNIEDVEKADMAIWWRDKKPEAAKWSGNMDDLIYVPTEKPKKHVVMRKYGVLRYCTEWFYPN